MPKTKLNRTVVGTRERDLPVCSKCVSTGKYYLNDRNRICVQDSCGFCGFLMSPNMLFSMLIYSCWRTILLICVHSTDLVQQRDTPYVASKYLARCKPSAIGAKTGVVLILYRASLFPMALATTLLSHLSLDRFECSWCFLPVRYWIFFETMRNDHKLSQHGTRSTFYESCI